MPPIYISKNASQTQRIGKILAEELLREKRVRKHAIVFALTGELGAGKTTFVQGFKKGLGISTHTPSPTFLIVRAYPAKNKNLTLWHIDCYRIKSPRDITELGFHDWVSHPDHIIVIEWGDRIKRILPKNTIHIYFEHGKKLNERIISIKKILITNF